MNMDDVFGDTAVSHTNVSSQKGTSETTLINIQNIDDPHARYKMPKLNSRIKEKGKFAETFVSNLAEVAQALKVDLRALLKFVESSLGSQFMLGRGTSEDQKDTSSYYIKGRFSYETLYQALRGFIDQYVLCTKCGLPELEYKSEIKEKKAIRSCKSCGYSIRIDPRDRIYKLLI